MQYTQPSSEAFAKAHGVLMREYTFIKKDLMLQVKTQETRSSNLMSTESKNFVSNNSNFLPYFNCDPEGMEGH